ncbi:MAG: hypothetical protein IPK81_15195 [Rhodospirillales bacterium]|nr:MAG: hypothetical protein IPK81_15195 [Rhodospirillales bacterium]
MSRPTLATPLHRLARAATLAAATFALTAGVGAMAQDTPRKPGKARSIPFVSITKSDGSTRYFETNAIPLLINKACFGWRAWLGGPNRSISLVEVLQTSQPAKDVIAGPETEVSEDKTRATTRMRERVVDGYLQRSWCIIEGDPPGTYTYHITIDGEPRGEFVFCAIELKEQDEDIDPTELSCPNKFQSVGAPAAPTMMAGGVHGGG